LGIGKGVTNFERTVVGGLEFDFVEVWGNEFGAEVWRQGLSILGQNGIAVTVVVGHWSDGGECLVRSIQDNINEMVHFPLMAGDS
jgi:hypothetical protein